jgi:hypothetical protein
MERTFFILQFKFKQENLGVDNITFTATGRNSMVVD